MTILSHCCIKEEIIRGATMKFAFFQNPGYVHFSTLMLWEMTHVQKVFQNHQMTQHKTTVS